MGRIRRFQRTMLTALTGINTFVFSATNGLSVSFALLYSTLAMLTVLTGIMIYSKLRKDKKQKQVSAVRILK